MTVCERNAVTVAGQGEKPLLFLHGFGCDQTMWRFIAPHFLDSNQVILVDHVGSGRSDLRAYDRIKYASLHGYADDLIEICEALGLTNADVVGHSVGGMIALLAAGKRPDLFDRLMLLGSSPCYMTHDGYHGGFTRQEINELLNFLELNYEAWAATMAPIVMGNPERPELAAELADYFRANEPEIAQHFARTVYTCDHRDDLSKVVNPVLIMQCTEDLVAPVEVGQYMNDRMAHSELVVLEVQGHYPQFSAPHLLRQVLTSYLAAPSGMRLSSVAGSHITGCRAA